MFRAIPPASSPPASPMFRRPIRRRFPIACSIWWRWGGRAGRAFWGRLPALDIEIAEEALETLSIAHLKDAACTEISGGERQLALIARALAQEARIPHHGRAHLEPRFRQSDRRARPCRPPRQGGKDGHPDDHARSQPRFVSCVHGSARLGREGTFTLGAPEQVVTRRLSSRYLWHKPASGPDASGGRTENERFPANRKSAECSGARKGLARLVAVRLLGLAIAGGGIAGGARAAMLRPARTVIDMTGRSVELPAKVERVACLEVLCYQKAPHAGRRQPRRGDDEDQRAVDGSSPTPASQPSR